MSTGRESQYGKLALQRPAVTRHDSHYGLVSGAANGGTAYTALGAAHTMASQEELYVPLRNVATNAEESNAYGAIPAHPQNQ